MQDTPPGMVAAIAFSTLLLCNCTGAMQSHEPDAPSPHPQDEPVGQPESPLDDGQDHCDPLPQEGSPCPPDASYCVIDWGQPCGSSLALWCMEGVWVIEEEANLCEP